ncbi:TauD/TfdA family dioxygenase [Porticoccaceae bacterium]|nr:TauD/TfdA family dioxygenase [Porticoccaceae bacterium]
MVSFSDHVELVEGAIVLRLKDGSGTAVNYDLPNLWLRDNCPCDNCRVPQTQEKRFILSSVAADISPQNVLIEDAELKIIWPDSHKTCYTLDSIRGLIQPTRSQQQSWPDDFIPPSYQWDLFLQNSTVATEALERFMRFGVILITDAPTEPETLEQLAPMLGPIRELLFERIHNVSVEGHVYNIAHTSLGLPPHNDFASYSFPPSAQALHMLHNEVPGGNSIVVDGWAVLEQLRLDHPDYFRILCDFAVPFREFDDNNETFAVEPMIRCDSAGNIVSLRFSNQLMQIMNPMQKGIKEFYRAYHELCVRVADIKHRSTFRLEGGQIILVAAHRVLHAREAFQPIGKRHLQDAYFELDNIANKLVWLKRQ